MKGSEGQGRRGKKRKKGKREGRKERGRKETRKEKKVYCVTINQKKGGLVLLQSKQTSKQEGAGDGLSGRARA